MLPNKDKIERIYSYKNYEKYNIIFWYSDIVQKLDELLDANTNEKTSMELTMNLDRFSELDPILTFINDKKLEIIGEEKALSPIIKGKIKQMLRGLLISKIRNNNIDLNEFNEISKVFNSRIFYTDEIPDEEYYYTYSISDRYEQNLKIKIPIFKPMDAFYFFYCYDKMNRYKLGELFNEIKYKIGGVNDYAQEILKKSEYKNMIDLSEDIGKLFYTSIYIKEPPNEENICELIKQKAEREIDYPDRKELLSRIASGLDFIRKFQEKIVNNQKVNKLKLEDFYNLLDDKNNLLDCSSIFNKEKISQIIIKVKIAVYFPHLLFTI